MAFKKTGRSSIRVSPTGIPDFSGYQRAAAEYNSVAESFYGLGADIRKQDLNNAILDAEAAGRTAGATYDKDNNLVPLTNLDLSKAIEDQVFGESAKQELRNRYKQSALKTYAATVSLDAKTIAQNAFNNNQDDPDAIRGALDGYIENLGVEDEVLEYVMPNIISHFTAYEGMANSNQIKKANAFKERVNLDNITDVGDRLATIIAKGPGDNPSVAAGHQKMIAELQQDIEGSFDALRTVGYDDNQIAKLQEGINYAVAQRSSESHIERVYQTSGYTSALSEIVKVQREFAEDPNIDEKAIAQAMEGHLNRLTRITNAQEQDTAKRQSRNYGSAFLKVFTGAITDERQIMMLDIGDSEKGSLLGTLRGAQSTIQNQIQAAENAAKAGYKEMFDQQMVFLNNPDAFTEEQINSSTNVIMSMISDGLIKGTDVSSFYKAKVEIAKDQIKNAGDQEFMLIKSMMGANSDYSLTGKFFADQTELLVTKGYVGTGPGATMTRSQWQGMINDYSARKTTYDEKAKEVIIARAQVKSGFGDSRQINLVQEMFATNELQADENGQIWLHSNPQVREENFNVAVRFTAEYGVLPEQLSAGLKDLSTAADQGEESFNVKVQIYDKLYKSLIMGTAGSGTTDLAMPAIIAKKRMMQAGVDVLGYEVARILGFKVFRDTMATKSQGAVRPQRVISSLEGQYPSMSDAIRGNFEDAVGPDWWKGILNWTPLYKTPDAREQSILKRLADSGPGDLMDGNIADSYIADDRLMNLVEGLVMNEYQKNNELVNLGDEGLKQAISNAVIRLSDDGNGNPLVGLTVDSQGNPYYTVYPWYQAAKQSIGDVPTGGKSVDEMVFNDIRQKITGPGFMISDTMRELLSEEDGGQIFLEANPLLGSEQTYTVKVRDPDTGSVMTVANDYRYNFATSIDFPAYVLAVDTVQNSTVKSFMASLPYMKPVVIDSVKQEIDKQYDAFNDPGVRNEVLNFIYDQFGGDRQNTFFDFGITQLPNRTVNRADMEVLVAFIRGEIDTSDPENSRQQIIDMRRKFEEEDQ